MPQKKIGFNDSQLKADKLIIHNGLTASATLEFVGANPLTFRLPQTTGTAGQAVVGDGLGNLSFATMSGGVGPTGPAGATFSGTTNRIAKFTGATAIGDSTIVDNATSVVFTSPQIFLPDGSSAATPSISFTGLNAGIFTPGVPPFGIGVSVGTDDACRFTVQQLAEPGLLLRHGSAAAPSLSFFDPTLPYIGIIEPGLFRASLDELGISAGAVESARFRPGGLLSKDGSAATPSISFINDTDTGIFRRATNELNFSIGGTELLRLDADPGAGKLVIQNNGSAAAVALGINDNNTGLFRVGTDILNISAGGVESGRFTTQSFRALEGSVALPGISFINDADTGLFRSVVNQLSISAGGVESGRFTTQSFRAPSGTLALPGISFISDQDTGMFRQATNVVSIAAGGIEAARFTATGMRSINGTIGAPGLSFLSDSSIGFSRVSVQQLNVSVSGTEVGRFTTAGMRSIDGSAATPSISFISDTNTGIYLANPDQIGFTTGGAIRMFISSSAIRSYVVHRFADGTAAAPAITFQNDTDTGIFTPAADQLAISAGGLTASIFDASTTAGETRLLLFDVDSGTTKRVSVGAADSGGVGFKTLRIPN